MKVAIIGLGYRLGYLGHVFNQMDPAFEIVGYHDPAPAGLATLAEHGISPGIAHSTAEALVKAGGYDLLMIGSPNYLHLDHIRLGLEAGNMIFSENPSLPQSSRTMRRRPCLSITVPTKRWPPRLWPM